MAIQYYMRAFNTNLSQYVDWVVNDAPDSTGTFSGYPTGQLINITVNRVVQSKVANFLKQNQSLGGTDGYFFHVNSYDWKNATSPIAPPTNIVGIAVERGITALSPSSTIANASNTSPIVITLSSPPTVPLATGELMTIIGVQGNHNANGTWPIVVLTTSTFQLVGSTGSGTYTAGSGNAFLPKDMSTLTWDEANNVWRLVFNTNGDGTTLGASQSLVVNNFIMDGYLAIGPDPADTGAIRLSNNTFIDWESNPAGTDIQGIGVDNLNRIKLGSVVGDITYTPGAIDIDGYLVHTTAGVATTAAQTTGFIRDKNNTTIVAFRKADLSTDISALSSTSTNFVVLGDAINSSIVYNTATGGLHQFQVNSVPDFEIGNTFARFTSTVIAPTINQTVAATNISGQTLAIQAQNGGAGTSTGGILSLASGTGATINGTVDLSTGATLKVRIFPTTASSAADNNSISLFENRLRFDTAQLTPLIRQDDVTTSNTAGQAFTLQAQTATGTTSVGGLLNLTSGAGTSNAGVVNVQTGGTTQIIVSPLTVSPGTSGPATTGTVIIKGNLEVLGTTTTVDSTVVDIIGRVIHANWAYPTASPNVAVPSQNVGYSIHRGNASGAPRDGAAWIWTEGALNSGADGYWRALTNPGDGNGNDNFTAANSINSVGVLANNHSASADPNPVLGTLPGTGGFRAPNNIFAVVARNITPTTTIASGSNLATLPQGTINVSSTTGFTSAGTLLIQSDAGTQTVTYTGTSGGNQFTGGVGGTGLIHTGGTVTQVNNATTIASGSNNVSLPTGTINVASAVGFPSSGTLRIVTTTVAGSGTVSSLQTVAYTGTTGTTFTGCTGGSGTMNTGGSVSSPPIPGVADIPLLGTDFGNRILHGSPTINTGHVFQTSTGSIYDFQINSISQVQLRGDTDADTFTKTITIAPTVSTPKLYQVVRPDTGANAGFNLGVFAQAGQQQTGVTTNNNGGNLVVGSGAAGTGGSGAAGIHGTVDIQTGPTLKVRIFPTDASPVGSSDGDNSILYFESLFRVDTAQTGAGPLAGTGVRFRQDDNVTNGATAQNYTVQAQNATGTTSTGGDIINTSGTGTTTAGNNRLQTGGVDKIIVHPAFTEFRDTAEALRITPVSAGTTQITYAATVTSTQINQTQTTTAVGAPMSIQSQVTTLNGSTGGTLTLTAGNATGTTSTGGALNLASGSGTSTNGVINFQPGGVTQLLITATGAQIQWVTGVTAPTLKQNDNTTNSATAQPLTIQAQTATGTTSTGGNLVLQTGAGTSNPGSLLFNIGASNLLTLFNTATVPNTLQWSTGVTLPTINQAAVVTGSATGATFTIQAQNATGATSTGGQLALSSGSGTTTAGNVNIQCGNTTIISAQPTLVALTQTLFQFGTGVVTPLFRQADNTTVSGTGQLFTVQAQNATAATSTGGGLNLTSGSGTSTNGALNLQVGSVTTASAVTNKFVLNKGFRRNVTAVNTTYQVLPTDDYIAVTAGSVYTITLPATPTLGDTYEFKDINGTAGTNTVTVSGGAVNIDGLSSIAINANYAAFVVTYTGTQWSVS